MWPNNAEFINTNEDNVIEFNDLIIIMVSYN